MTRLKTGNGNLDLLLSGGLPENSINVIMGLPGTGKTILAESIIFNSARPDSRALYISSVSEPLDKIIHYLQDFSFFKAETIGESIIYEDLSETLRSQGLQKSFEKIKSLVLEYRPRMLVIDSFKALHPYAADPKEFRSFLSELASMLSSLHITSFLVGEYPFDEVSIFPEFAVADGIINLELQKDGVRDIRYVRIVKMRGTEFYGGEHAYRISSGGLEIFPRLTTPATPPNYEASGERTKSGVEVIDAMLDKGFWRGSSTAIFGPPGSGKTLLCLHTIFKGIESGDKGLIITMQENPTQLTRIASSFGWDVKKLIDKGMLKIVYTSPVEILMDELMIEIRKSIEEEGYSRVMIDSLNDLEASSADNKRFRNYMYAFVQSMAVKGVSLFMTNEIRDLFGTSYLSEFGISHMADNLILIHYLREQSEVKRAITVLKTRGSHHDARIRQFTIDSSGMRIGDEFSDKTSFQGA
ncbi:MAG: hypothetical protein M1539_07175 [Actinobacteria bacterium]|nr:hypothetical protein [Actinomycetota bacterium]MCL5883733.1 hypothetical protein [Actinomycetota bacterium]